MRYQTHIAIDGAVEPRNLPAIMDQRMAYFGESNVDEPGNGEWDWWLVGGRWRGSFTLNPDAVRRRLDGDLTTPIEIDTHVASSFQLELAFHEAVNRLSRILPIDTSGGSSEALLSHQTDCARLGDIEPSSVPVPFYWIDLEGRLRDLHYDPSPVSCDDWARNTTDYAALEQLNGCRYRRWLSALPSETWLINVDVHR